MLQRNMLYATIAAPASRSRIDRSGRVPQRSSRAIDADISSSDATPG